MTLTFPRKVLTCNSALTGFNLAQKVETAQALDQVFFFTVGYG